MSTELAPRFVIHPATGEKLELDAPDDQLALALDSIRTLEGQLRDVKSALGAELLQRMDQQAAWTMHVPGVGKVTAPSPKPTIEYDGPALREALLELADQGLITQGAVDAAVETVVTYEPRARGITALLRLGGSVEAVVASFGTETQRTRYVSVKRG